MLKSLYDRYKKVYKQKIITTNSSKSGGTLSEILEHLDKTKWGLRFTLAFLSLAIGYFMWGVISTIGILSYPEYHNIYYLVFISSIPIVGDLAISRLSDVKLGRKTTFFITMLLYAIGSILFIINSWFLSSNIYVALLAYTMGIIGVEGEVPVALSLISELFPLKYREKLLIILPNFDNVGAVVASLIAFITYSLSSSYSIEVASMGIVALVGAAFAILVRLSLPESIRWLVSKGSVERAREEIRKISYKKEEIKVRDISKMVPFGWRYAFLIFIGISQYLTYGLMAYIIAAYYFTGNAINLVVFFANLGASIAGVIAMFIVDSVGTRKFSVISYLGGFLSMFPIIAFVLFFPKNLILFYILLFLNMVFSEFGWGVRTVYEPTLMPTKSRAFLIGLIRFPIMVTYTASVYLTSTFTEFQFVLFNTFFWLLGAASSIGWYIKGYDIHMVPIEKTSGEAKKLLAKEVA